MAGMHAHGKTRLHDSWAILLRLGANYGFAACRFDAYALQATLRRAAAKPLAGRRSYN